MTENETIVTETAETQKPAKTPSGTIVLSVLLFMWAVLALLTIPSVKPETAILLGFKVPAGILMLFMLVSAIIMIYCAVGIPKLKNIARVIYLWWAAINVINYIATQIAIWNPAAANALIISLIINIAYYIFVFYYLISRKAKFVN
jgi:hypothetical protein